MRHQSLDLLRPISGRKSAIVLSDGMDNRDYWLAQLAGKGSQHTLEETVAQASGSGVTLYTIGLGQHDELNEPALQQLAAQTGGTYYHAPTAEELAGLYRTLSQQFQTEYAITYRSPRAAYDGTRRGIQVTVNAGSGQSGASSGAYIEQHLLQLRSTPLAGLVLAGLLLVALATPLLARRGRRSAVVRLPAFPPASASAEMPALPSSESSVVVGLARTCHACGASLRPTARFCTRCGRMLE